MTGSEQQGEGGLSSLMRRFNVAYCRLKYSYNGEEVFFVENYFVHWARSRVPSGDDVFVLDHVDDHVVWIGDAEEFKDAARYLFEELSDDPEDIELDAESMFEEAEKQEKYARDIEENFEKHVRDALSNRHFDCIGVSSREAAERCLRRAVESYREEAEMLRERGRRLLRVADLMREIRRVGRVEAVLECDGGLSKSFTVELKRRA